MGARLPDRVTVNHTWRCSVLPASYVRTRMVLVYTVRAFLNLQLGRFLLDLDGVLTLEIGTCDAYEVFVSCLSHLKLLLLFQSITGKSTLLRRSIAFWLRRSRTLSYSSSMMALQMEASKLFDPIMIPAFAWYVTRQIWGYRKRGIRVSNSLAVSIWRSWTVMIGRILSDSLDKLPFSIVIPIMQL